MHRAGLQECPGHGIATRSVLPLELRRQPTASPSGVGTRFVEAQVAHRLGGIQLAHAAQGHDIETAVSRLPVERRAPAFLVHEVPTIREPELRALVATVGDELRVLAAGDRTRGQLERLQQLAVPRTLVVVRERVAAGSYLDLTAGERNPLRLHLAAARTLTGA